VLYCAQRIKTCDIEGREGLTVSVVDERVTVDNVKMVAHPPSPPMPSGTINLQGIVRLHAISVLLPEAKVFALEPTRTMCLWAFPSYRSEAAKVLH
jgi:hypothetical protein